MAESEGFDTSGRKPAVSLAAPAAGQPLKKSRALAEFSRRQRRRLSTVGALLIRNTSTRRQAATSRAAQADLFTSGMKWSDFTSKA